MHSYMKRYIAFIATCLLMRFALSAQSAPDWYPKVDDAVATFVNHEGEEEEIETGGTYDAPLTVTMFTMVKTLLMYVLYAIIHKAIWN